MADVTRNEVFRCLANLQAVSESPVIIQTTNEFVDGVLSGNSALFRTERNHQEDGGSSVLFLHETTKLHFYSKKDTLLHKRVKVVNSERFAVKFEHMDEFRAYKKELLSKPFLMHLVLKARRKSGNTTYIMKLDTVVTVQPKHELIAGPLAEAFEKAEKDFLEERNFALELKFIDIVYKWYKSALFQTTGHRWGKPMYDKQSWELTLTNHSARLKFCNHPGCLVLGVYLCPLYALTYLVYKGYRKAVINTYQVELVGHAHYGRIIM